MTNAKRICQLLLVAVVACLIITVDGGLALDSDTPDAELMALMRRLVPTYCDAAAVNAGV